MQLAGNRPLLSLPSLSPGGEQALVVLALALAEQLLVPLVHQGEVGLVALEDLDLLALAAEDVAGCGVLVSVVVGAQHREPLHGVGSALHQLGDVDAGGGDGQQAHSRQHRVAAAHVVGDHEGGPALAVSQLLQGALGPVGGGVDPLVGLFGAHLILQQLAQHTEGQAGLGGGAGLGDDVDGEPLALAQGDDVIQCGGADAVAAEVNLQARLQLVVVDALDGLHHSPGAQIAAADAGHNQDVGIAADLFGRSLDAGELFLIIIPGQIHPAQEVVAGAGLGLQALVGCSYLGIDGSKLILFDKRRKVLGVKRNAHDSRPPNRSFPYVSRGGQREQISAAGAGVRILSLSVPFHSHKVKAKILRIHTFLTRRRRAVL